ncbi:YnbE family lipoprotein [Candidatus Thiosymbion oneisti]|uniref:YnbE family lipoprotein n=1 Tax=Candidatus Thiosymbion oneisti TaxID=589554 RepID=UPI000B02DF86|nr:YnbE family lipoprotein [Candidatus Thiosymbion oneisti]
MRIIGTGQWGSQETMTRGLRVRSKGVPSMSRMVWVLLAATVGVGCSPRVKVEAPDKPIEINVNVKIEQEVRIKLDETVERTLAENPELFGTETKP